MLFQRPVVQNPPREHAPGPPKQLAPSALVIGPPNKSNLATALYPHFFISAPFSVVRVLGTSRYHDSEDNENGKKQGTG